MPVSAYVGAHTRATPQKPWHPGERRSGPAVAPIAGMSRERVNSTEEPTPEEKLENVVRLAFHGERARYDAFCRAIREVVPPGTTVVLRGSAVTGRRWKDGAPFDTDGPGTSDLDLTLVGDDVIGFFKATGFFVPGIHSRPMGEDDPDIAPDLVPLRERLMAMVGRPVNIQASREMVMYFRGELLGQPYHVLLDTKADDR